MYKKHMNDKKFVEEFYKLKQSLLKDYFSNEQATAVAKLIQTLDLNRKQTDTMRKIIDISLTDTLYTVLIGLEGSATIGEEQEAYKLFNEEGVEITGKKIEEYAWELFQNQ
ncbi:MAG: hypothetical protein N0C84_03215 [Candidatus Thiodiazotropha taylori]|uniref:Uncharacterized protein n=1 Tax=Candidatus Thiodiazotropha taylori TaxID=2792791 RepID=A0A9E4KAZ7_9GAMM|nr:hypothetical protein [Candidatus Thiodiazotropha taylori]MCG7945334.1 hypothetical protein [Candidatus Thiodiazotropha taylori]MCW4255448.1 hypothetical protein [Candidatus Thiodiazotropha taylori]MCW4255458.1 hypothetical protein [Candidatus Thiodiazotropha taylori]